MADKPNKSNRPINGQIPKHIEEAISSRDYATSYEHLSGKEDYRKLVDKLENLENATQTQSTIENYGYAEQDLMDLDKSYHDRQNSLLADKIGTYTKSRNINSRTTTASNQQRYHRGARSSGDIYMPTESIESRIQGNTGAVNALGMEVAGRIRGVGIDEIPQSLMPKLGQISGLEEQIAFDKRLLKVQNRSGLSTEKMFNRADDVMGTTSRYFEGRGVANKVSSGNVRDIGTEENTLGHMSSNVSRLQGDYDMALEKGSSKVALFAEKLVKATEALDKQQKLVTEMNRQGVDGPGGPGGMSRSQMLMGAAGLAGIAANTASTIGIDYNIEQTQLRTAYAGLANRQYQKTDEFVGGSMAAFLELSDGGDLANIYSNRMRDRSTVFKGAGAIAAGVDSGISTAFAAKSFMSGGDDALKLGLGAASQVANAAKMASRLGMGIEQGGTGLKAYMGGLELSNALNFTKADTMQNYFDIGRGAFDQGMGLGSGRGGFMSSMTNASSLKRFADVGLTGPQAIQAAGMAIPNVGTTEDYSNMVLKAGQAHQRGILGVSDYMSGVGQLANVGGGSGDLESIMSKAISAGMENAKNINQMVQATSAMASGNAAIGVSTVGATGNMLTASIQSMRNMGVGKNIATGAATNAVNAADQAGNIMGSFADLQYRAAMKDTYGKELGHYEQLGLRNLDQATMKEILDGSDTGKKYVEQFGLGSVLDFGENGLTDDGRGKLKKLRRGLTTKEVIEQMTPMAAMSNMGVVRDMVSSRLDGTSPSNRSKLIFGSTAGKMAGAVKYSNANEVHYADDIDSPGPGVLMSRPRSGNRDEEAFQLQDILKGTRTADKASAGKVFSEDYGGLAGVVAGMEEALKATPEKMGEAVSKAAEDLKAPASLFKDGSKDFRKAVDKFVTHVENMGVTADSNNTEKVFSYRGERFPTKKK